MDGWIMNNGQWSGSVSVGSFDANYIVAGSGDFDRSHTADILWRNPFTGQANEWLLATA